MHVYTRGATDLPTELIPPSRFLPPRKARMHIPYVQDNEVSMLRRRKIPVFPPQAPVVAAMCIALQHARMHACINELSSSEFRHPSRSGGGGAA